MINQNAFEMIQGQIADLKSGLADLRVVERIIYGCRVYNSTTINHTSSGSWQNITFDSDRDDPQDMHNTSTNTDRINCLLAGWYYMFGNLTWDNNASGIRELAIRLNDTTVIGTSTTITSPDGTVDERQSVATFYHLDVDDYITLYAYQSSGGTLQINQASDHTPVLGMIKF